MRDQSAHQDVLKPASDRSKCEVSAVPAHATTIYARMTHGLQGPRRGEDGGMLWPGPQLAERLTAALQVRLKFRTVCEG